MLQAGCGLHSGRSFSAAVLRGRPERGLRRRAQSHLLGEAVLAGEDNRAVPPGPDRVTRDLAETRESPGCEVSTFEEQGSLTQALRVPGVEAREVQVLAATAVDRPDQAVTKLEREFPLGRGRRRPPRSLGPQSIGNELLVDVQPPQYDWVARTGEERHQEPSAARSQVRPAPRQYGDERFHVARHRRKE